MRKRQGRKALILLTDGVDNGSKEPLSAAIESTATTLDEIISEMMTMRTSERSGRLIDADQAASMEKKKREGYF